MPTPDPERPAPRIRRADAEDGAAINRVKTLIDEAIDFGATLAMVQGPLDTAPDQRAATTERLAQDMQVLCDYATARSQTRQLFLTLENFDRDIEK